MTKSARAGPFTASDLQQAMKSYGGPMSRAVAENPKLLKSTFDLIKAVHNKDPLAGASAVAGGASAGSKAFHASKAVQTAAKSTSFGLSELNATMSMTKAARLTSVGAVTVFVGATVVHKSGLAVSLAGGDDERARCVGALMELAGTAAVTAVTAPTGVLLALSAASLAASSYNAYLSCRAP